MGEGRRSRSVPALILGLLLLAMAAGQVSDVAGFADVLDGYRLVPERLLRPAAWLLVGAEAMAGVALLRSRRSGPTLAVVVAVVWSILAVSAFARGIPLENCGCFGVHLRQPLRWWVLVQDAWFVAAALLVRRSLMPPAAPTGSAPPVPGGVFPAGAPTGPDG